MRCFRTINRDTDFLLQPYESTFLRAFAEFSLMGLAERCHEFLVKSMLGDHLIGHISRDGTAIHAREKTN